MANVNINNQARYNRVFLCLHLSFYIFFCIEMRMPPTAERNNLCLVNSFIVIISIVYKSNLNPLTVLALSFVYSSSGGLLTAFVLPLWLKGLTQMTLAFQVTNKLKPNKSKVQIRLLCRKEDYYIAILLYIHIFRSTEFENNSYLPLNNNNFDIN